MRESILTIPITEVLEPTDDSCGCPLCRMEKMLEDRTVEYIMGAAMMEPDVRIETNKLGFCDAHYTRMLKQKNRLSLALMLQTHLDKISQDIFESKRPILKKDKRIDALRGYERTCFVCEKIKWGMDRLTRTFCECYENPKMREMIKSQPYICLRHYRLLSEIAPQFLGKKEAENFAITIGDLVNKHLQELYKDVSHFCSMYDYRNGGKDADWGNSRDSIERAISFLT
jgi:hypothetical protein